MRLVMLTDFTETFSHRLLRGLLNYAQASQTQWVVCRMPLSFKEQHGIEGVIEWAERWHADAIMGKFLPNDKPEQIEDAGIICVAQDHKALFNTLPNITSDYHTTGHLAAEYFINRGFTHFAFCGYADAIWSCCRCDGFKETILSHFPNQNINLYLSTSADEPWQLHDKALVTWLKSLPNHTAVFCCDDRQASMILTACNEAEINIPKELAVLGVDNDELSDELCQPTLSSINLDIETGGYQLGEMITKIKTHGKNFSKNIIIKPGGIVNRESTNTFATTDVLIQKAVDIIHSQINSAISVNDLLKQLPMSRRLLEIRFKEAVGTTLHQYILEKRLNAFAQALIKSDKQIKEIALEMQFNNYGNLIRSFYDKEKCTPSTYRDRHKSTL